MRKVMLILGGIVCMGLFYQNKENVVALICANVWFVGFIVYDGIINYFKQFEE